MKSANQPVARRLAEVATIIGADRARIQELAGFSTGLLSHSLAVIIHPAGTSSRAHHHLSTDEVYYVREGTGGLMLDGRGVKIQPGDIIEIRAGQRHKVWNDGPEDLVLLVSCSPAHRPQDVVWDEDEPTAGSQNETGA